MSKDADKLDASTADSSSVESDSTIDRLVAQASASGNTDDLKQLWKATLQLRQWHFITRFQENPADRKPFVGVTDGKPWIFVFTSRSKAKSYASRPQNPGFTDPDGQVMVISMNTDKAIEFLATLEKSGAYGVRINEGSGWFSPLSDLPAIIKEVKGN